MGNYSEAMACLIRVVCAADPQFAVKPSSCNEEHF